MKPAVPDHTAVRVALWRALHVLVDPPPHVLEDDVGLRLVAPDEGWRRRPDMDERASLRSRASIVARARFIEDLAVEQASRGLGQYAILGAGLDTFAQRRPEIARGMRIFEVDRPGPQAWKRQRLIELGFGIPDWLRLVPVDFEAGSSWWEELASCGFDAGRPAVVASTGVTMYLTRDAIVAMLRQVAALAPGLDGSHELHAAAGVGRIRGARLSRGDGAIRASCRDAFRQLVCAAADAGTGTRSRLQGISAGVRGEPYPALFRRKDRRPSAVERRGTAGRDDLS